MNRMQALLFAFFAAASSLPEDSGPPLTACPADGSGCDPPFPPSPPAYVPSQPAQYRLEPEIQGGFYFESLNVTLAVPPVPSVPEAINGSIIITSSIEFKVSQSVLLAYVTKSLVVSIEAFFNTMC